MPAFRFEAIDATGKAQKGVLDADSARGARTHLRGQGLTPLVVEPASSRTRGERNQRLSLGRRLSQREQAILTRQLASLLIAGLPLDEALVCADRTVGARLHPRTDGVDSRRGAGRPFARQRAAAASERLSGDLPGAGGRGRTYRQARSGAVAPCRLHRTAQRAQAEDRAGVHVSDHRHDHRVRHCHVPAELCGAAGRQRVREHQAAVAVPHHHDDGAVRLRAGNGGGRC